MNYAENLRDAFLAGASLLNKNKDYINELNVFPVPDGDTGTNMSMTLKSACDAVNAVTDVSVLEICKAIASGSLRGARGNSGVIMSQIIRGFTNRIQNEKEITTNLILEAVIKAKETAYKAVIKPKEGTILTVIRALAEKAEEVKNSNDEDIVKFEKIVAYGDEVLLKTPEMLPILKEAGVVDSGGQGLMYFAHGMLSYMKGEKIEYSFDGKLANGKVATSSGTFDIEAIEKVELKFGYCTECIINSSKGFKKDAVEKITKYLEKIGDSLVVVGDDQYIKIHVHTNNPGLVFEKALEYGFLTSLKVDNLKLEHHEKVIKDTIKEKEKQAKYKDIGFVAVSSGEGLSALFTDLGCDYIISGGQTMNPSTADFVDAVGKVNAKTVFVFPNNSNIIMAANAAKELIKDKDVQVINTKNVLQGLNALMYFTELKNISDIVDSFNETISNMKTIQTTYAVRDTTIDGIEIKEKDFISIGDKGMLSSNADIINSIFEAYEKIKEDKDSIVSIYYGEDIKEKDAKKLKEEFEKRYSNVEASVYEGGQQVYYYYISIE